MKLREVFRFEIGYLLRRPTTWVYPVFLFGLAFLAIGGDSDGPNIGNVNSPESLTGLAMLPGLLGILITAALFGDAAVRDVQTGMDPLLFTSRQSKVDYLFGRFLAALVVNAVLLVVIPIAQHIAVTVISSSDPDDFGPVQVAAYLQPLIVLLLPNLVIVSAILFTIAILARQMIPVYLGAIGIFVSYMAAVNYAESFDNRTLATLLDPLGLVVVQDTIRQWTTIERDTRLIGFPAPLILNRAVWLAIAGIVLVVLHRRFRFAHGEEGRVGLVRRVGRMGTRRVAPHMTAHPALNPPGLPAPPAPPALVVPRVEGTFRPLTGARQMLAIARHSLEEIVVTRMFLAVLLGEIGLTLLFGWEAGDAVFDTSTWPLTILIVERLLDTPLVPITFVLISVYAAELVWKAREVGVAEIADATPTSEAVSLLGRFLALVAILATLQGGIVVGGVVLQVLKGYYNFEVGLYLRILLGLNLAHIVIAAALAMAIHVLVNHKYLGHVLVVMALVFPVIAGEAGVIRHHLLLYGLDAGWTYSNMNGLGPFVEPLIWFKLYWAAWALLLGVISVLCWVRGRESGLRVRLREARARFAGAVARTAGAVIALILVLGAFIFYNTNVLNAYRTPEEEALARAEYETRYSHLVDRPQPTIVDVDLRIEIYPEEPAVDIRGTYRLVNRTSASIDSVHVTFMDPRVEARSITFDRAAAPAVIDHEVAHRIYSLEQALVPGDSLLLAFDVSFRPRGFPNSDIQTAVIDNGTSFDGRFLPAIGYQEQKELSGAEQRRRVGLEPKPPMPSADDEDAKRYRGGLRNEDVAHITVVVGTASDQIAITAGALRKEWIESGRRYFHYESQPPALFGGSVFSARWAVVEDRWHGVDLRILHHPGHTYVIDRMARAMKASLEYFTAQFGPYPYSQLRLIELPRYGGFGRAYPNMMSFTEDAWLSRVREGEIDQPFYGVAHEVAHQWWGGMIGGAAVQGAGFLSESLANYSAMMVTEKTYGLDVARRVYDFQMQRYLDGRAFQSREVPLLRVEDQPYIAYRKGAIAMYTLRDLIGEERVNAALRRYFEKFRPGGPPFDSQNRELAQGRSYPTSLDLYAELRAVTPDAFHTVLQDWFEEVTLWEVRTERATVERTANGEYQVILDVVAKKLRADSVGNETEVPMDDLVEIGIFAAPGEGDGSGDALYLQRHHIRSGQQTIRVTVSREPTRAGIDPYRKLIDRQRGDNLRDVTR